MEEEDMCSPNPPSSQPISQSSQPISPFSGPFRPQKLNHHDEILLNFDKLSIQEKYVSLQQMETILGHMKEKSLQQLPLSEVLVMLGVQQGGNTPSKQNLQSPSRPFQETAHTTPPKSASSISSSVPSSWSTPSFQPSPVQFNFKTPQKIFVFETNKSPKVESKEASLPPEAETVPPTFNPQGNGVSKSLFVDLTNEDSGEESKDSSTESKSSFVPSAPPTFSLGIPPSNKASKGSKKGSKKSESVPSKLKGNSLFSSTSQSHKHQPPPQPFVFGSGSVFPEQNTNQTSETQAQSGAQSNMTPDDDNMEIGQSDDTPTQSGSTDPKIWNFSPNSQPFGSNIPKETSGIDSSQVPKKKSTSAIKRRLRSQKKVPKEDLSKLDHIFSNISLQNPAQTESAPNEQAKPFIFFPPPPPNANGSTPFNENTMNSESKPEKDTSADARKIHMAEIFKREGKDMYSLQRYDLAYHAFTKCLQIAPQHWQDRSNILSNRAAALIMMERLVEAISDCNEASSIDPQFVKVYTRKGRALLKLGQLTDASDAFCFVLSWQPPEPETNHEEGDRYGKDLARQAMKQVVLAKTLRDRLLNESCGSNKQLLQTADELLSLCPYMRLAQTFKAQALCQLKRWAEAKSFMELCVCSIHHTMQALHAHSAADFSILDIQCLNWTEAGYSVLQVDVDTVVAAILTMGADMAKWYLMCLKNQDICRTSCSAESMLKYHEILLHCRQLTATDLDGKWDWIMDAEKQIRVMISLKNEADEKFRNSLFMEAIQSYTEVLEIDEHAHLWNAIMFGNRAASSMRLGMFHEAVSDCHQSLARDEYYSRAYLRRARAHRVCLEIYLMLITFRPLEIILGASETIENI